MIILYQNIINILILRSIKQASWTIQFSQQASEHKRNSVADRIVMKRDISTEDVSKIQKCGQFLRGFKISTLMFSYKKIATQNCSFFNQLNEPFELTNFPYSQSSPVVKGILLHAGLHKCFGKQSRQK